MADKGIYQGNYEVTYSQKPDVKTDTKPVISTFKRIEMTGCPCALLCFERKRGTSPAQIIPWDRVIGIREIEQPAKGVKSEPKVKARKAPESEPKSR